MKRVADMLGSAVGQKQVLRAARAQALFGRWSEVVGETLAAKSTPDRFEDGTLWVVVKGAAWGQELRLREDLVLARLNDLAGEPGLFLEMRVAVGPKRRDMLG